MDHISTGMIIVLVVCGFLAGFIDSVVGGGGLISIPALLSAGIPLHLLLGSNKLAGTMCSFTSTASFVRSGKINFQLLKLLIPFSIIGAVAGSFTVRQVPSEFLKPLVIVMLVVITIYTLFKRSWGDVSTFSGSSKKTRLIGVMVAFVIGFYDGFFGPGTGSFLIFAFLMLGFEFVTAAGNAKVLNFASNISSLLTFIALGSVSFYYGLLLGVPMVAGAVIGSKVAIRKGAGYIRPLFITVTVILIGKQIWDTMH
ncbi:TSUP family transporter [Paenibacillus tianjinensis]|uniref:Probable membrane transporter protein n=1 Tax=Paenibacillus tianjinensis TaxID=2810347 RepID=A0ABX7LIZ9_9BACL|nr:TSUP family transporter [Paenibacillus tianjinensis]QSF47328.1 TSUP family transporter [Paenibacillus tianjinensis]